MNLHSYWHETFLMKAFPFEGETLQGAIASKPVKSFHLNMEKEFRLTFFFFSLQMQTLKNLFTRINAENEIKSKKMKIRFEIKPNPIAESFPCCSTKAFVCSESFS